MRQPPASERPASQRAPREVRDASAEDASWKAKYDILLGECTAVADEVKLLKPHGIDGYCARISPMKNHSSKAFYDQADVIVDCLRRYDDADLPDLVPTAASKLVLVGNKPFIRHVSGMLSHNADAFGAPFCTCSDSEAKMYNARLETEVCAVR